MREGEDDVAFCLRLTKEVIAGASWKGSCGWRDQCNCQAARGTVCCPPNATPLQAGVTLIPVSAFYESRDAAPRTLVRFVFCKVGEFWGAGRQVGS